MCWFGVRDLSTPSFALRNTENILDAEGSSPLHLAVMNDNPQCVKLLLNHRAHITTSKHSLHPQQWWQTLYAVENAEGLTALDIAVERKYDECIELVSPPSSTTATPTLSLLYVHVHPCHRSCKMQPRTSSASVSTLTWTGGWGGRGKKRFTKPPSPPPTWTSRHHSSPAL